MYYSACKFNDIANGPGVRTSLFVSGCRLHCPHCFNTKTWSFEYGEVFDHACQDNIIESLKPSYISGFTLLGGEPFEPENQAGIVDFILRLRALYPTKSLWAYTGYTWDILRSGQKHTPYTESILACLDVLVDGPYKHELHDVTLRFRGSSNQRLIDVPKSLELGDVVLWKDDPLFEPDRGACKARK